LIELKTVLKLNIQTPSGNELKKLYPKKEYRLKYTIKPTAHECERLESEVVFD